MILTYSEEILSNSSSIRVWCIYLVSIYIISSCMDAVPPECTAVHYFSSSTNRYTRVTIPSEYMCAYFKLLPHLLWRNKESILRLSILQNVHAPPQWCSGHHVLPCHLSGLLYNCVYVCYCFVVIHLFHLFYLFWIITCKRPHIKYYCGCMQFYCIFNGYF